MSHHRIESLYQRFGQLPGVTLEIHKELMAVNVKNRLGSATIFLQGAQISHFQPTDEKPLLFLSDDCDFKEGSPLRGGIPICWPWFGHLHQNPQHIIQQLRENGVDDTLIESAPAHGIVRDKEWDLTKIVVKPEATVVTLTLEISAKEQAYWPFFTQLSLDVSVSDALDVSLTITNQHHRAFAFSGALHTYFRVNDISQVDVHGLAGKSYVNTVGNWERNEQTGAVNINSEVDRIYQDIDDLIMLNDKSDEHSVSLRHSGCNSLVVWNPWINKAERLSQFKNDDYKRMMCLESANILEHAVSLAPKESHTMSMTLR